ncbi:MAG TPA: ketoacyl-ACP synthase III [Victivallales bacterium]|nr:ketoacyl-ACP synthase III [Victivallales bacterium]
MLGIEAIASYIPEKRVSNYDRKKKFGITDEFIKEKIGVERIAIKDDSEDSSDLCVTAYKNLKKKIDINDNEIEALIVVTQNPDYTLPQTSAILHGKLGLQPHCASFDVSLGCSGFVYTLSILQSFMAAHGFKKGLLFTSDPYSKIIDPDDKNTSLLFGDAAAVALISDNPVFVADDFTFGTAGHLYKDLICENKVLYMNGRGIFNFVVKQIPPDIDYILEKNGLTRDSIDMYLLHPGSRSIISKLTRKMELKEDRVLFDTYDYGNTVSSSIPIILEKIMHDEKIKLALASSFGVGLSWSSTILRRV